MRNVKRRVVAITTVIAMAIMMAIFMPSMVGAKTTVRQANKIINTTTSETLIFGGKEHNSTIYAGEIKKDGVVVLNYLYSDDVTRSSVLFDNVRKALSNPYSDMVPIITTEQTESGLKELSVSTLNGIDLTTITSGWKNASNIATQIYNGTNTDIVNSNMYDVDNGFKTGVDANETDRAAIDNPIANNKRIISHLGTASKDTVSFKVIDEQLIEIHDVNLTYLSEATTVIYTSVNVTTDSTPATQITTTYEYIDNTANQTHTLNKDDTLTFRINADYSLFENGGKVYVDDDLVSSDNYTSKSGSTIITFTKDYMSSLAEGEHTLKVAFNNGGSATTKFTVAKANTTTDTTPTTTTETNKKISNNPKTGDDIITIFSIFAITTLGTFTTLKLNRNRKTRKH